MARATLSDICQRARLWRAGLNDEGFSMSSFANAWFRAAAGAALMTTMIVVPNDRAAAHDFKVALLTLKHPWTRATAGKVGAGFVEIVNAGKAGDRLVSASSTAAEKVEIHTMSMDGGIMRMRPLADGVAVPAGATTRLQPGGNHLMLIGLKAPLTEGSMVPLTLNFAKAGPVKVTLKVEAAGASAPAPAVHAH
jgi:copper(I)-binding protein